MVDARAGVSNVRPFRIFRMTQRYRKKTKHRHKDRAKWNVEDFPMIYQKVAKKKDNRASSQPWFPTQAIGVDY